MTIAHEVAFEREICEHLAAHGWLYSENDDGYDRERVLYPDDVLSYLQETQPDAVAKLRGATDRILDRITKIASVDPATGGGSLALLREPVEVTPAKLQLFQSKPATGFNTATASAYAATRLRVMRQVRYSTRNANELDLVLFVNGIPVATVELKTDLTQSAEAALRQYARDRQPTGEPLLEFGRGALVHFVVSNELVYMTTRLAGANTQFLPFNVGRDHGAGNPPRPGTSPTGYLWEELWQRDAWIDLLGRFLHYRVESRTDPVTDAHRTSTSLRFPRYHQWRAVTRLEAAARAEGAGHSYLVQHSAGSGKTDTIAWTAHRMASLHRDDGGKVFDGVLVVSDRRVLDGQLKEAVERLATKPGVFLAITGGTESSKSAALAAALAAGKPIIGVTLQTFPFALERLREAGGLHGRHYAVIADEAHSSQSGDASSKLRELLAVDEGDESSSIDTEDVLAAQMAAKAEHPGLSFFAFTATPKGKTVELFGRPDGSGIRTAFDLYPMKQAIEEGFILDVLKNYVTYDTAFRIAHTDSADPDEEVDVRRASSELLRWVRLHPHNIAQKVAIIVEHFRRNVAPELGGQAKAMVVTDSRKAAVRYKLAMDRYLVERDLADRIGVLVAFSGTVTDGTPEVEHTETTDNPGLVGRALEKAFETDAYQVMIVANKFQTGFDQPMLVGMYIDRKLSGITAVQTLSRLNRVVPGKENTYVLDFVNDGSAILEAFQTYYEDASLDRPSDPDLIHDMRRKLRSARIIDEDEVERVAREWLLASSHNRLYSHLATSRDTFWDRWRAAIESGNETARAELEEFRTTVGRYVTAYDFLSQIIDYGDTAVEKWAIFLRVYRRVIQRQDAGTAATVADDIVLTHYRLRRRGEQALGLAAGAGEGLAGLTEAGTGVPREPQYGPLSAVIQQINDLFVGSGIEEGDQVATVEWIMRKAAENPDVQAQAMANTEADFRQSPDLGTSVEDVAYSSAAGQSAAMQVVLQKADVRPLLRILLDAGLYGRARDAATRDAE